MRPKEKIFIWNGAGEQDEEKLRRADHGGEYTFNPKILTSCATVTVSAEQTAGVVAGETEEQRRSRRQGRRQEQWQQVRLQREA